MLEMLRIWKPHYYGWMDFENGLAVVRGTSKYQFYLSVNVLGRYTVLELDVQRVTNVRFSS